MRPRSFLSRRMRSACMTMAFLGVSGAIAQPAPAWRALPADPVAGETFVVQKPVNLENKPFPVHYRTKVNGKSIFLAEIFPPGASGWYFGGSYIGSQAAGPLSEGTYEVRYAVDSNLDSVGTGSLLGSLVVLPAPPPVQPAFTTLSGMWFKPDEPGTGMNLVQGQQGNLFAVYMGYAEHSGNPAWLVMPGGRWVTPTRFRGVVYETEGTPMSGAWVASAYQAHGRGLLTLEFTSASDVTFTLETPSVGNNDTPYFMLRTLRTRMRNQPF